MHEEVSTLRLYLMRGLYLLIAVGLGSLIWPGIIHHAKPWGHMQGVANAFMAALSALALVGVRYPLQMLPLLLFELLWKSIWLLAVALPLWSANQLDPNTRQTITDCLVGIVLCPLVIPWGYVLRNYVRKRGDRWGGTPPAVEVRSR
ncbi:MAG: hypothetical protein ABIU86_07245 [Gemmatimonadaceae bacterium]